MLRGLFYQAPDVPVELRVDVAEQDDTLTSSEVRLTFAFAAQQDGGRVGNVARTRLVSLRETGASELPMLLQFTVSSRLLSLLNARLEIRDTDRHAPEVLLLLPVSLSTGLQATCVD